MHVDGVVVDRLGHLEERRGTDQVLSTDTAEETKDVPRPHSLSAPSIPEKA